MIHTSITLYERKVKFKIGVLRCVVNYDEILNISEEKWQRPLSRNTSNAHVIYIKSGKSVGIEHDMFSRDTTLKIVKKIKSIKN